MNAIERNTMIHQGRNIKRFREMLGIKQEAFAQDLGDDWSQKKVSLLEAKEAIEPAILQQVATVLKIPVEAIENFNEEQAVNIISNTFHDNAMLNAINHNPIFYPIEELKKLHEEKMALYERMLKEKEEMMARLQKLIERK